MEVGLTHDEARALVDSHDLIAIGMLAEAARQRRHGSRITFVRVAKVRAGGPLPAASAGAGEWRIQGFVKTLEECAIVVRDVVAAARGVPVTGFVASDLVLLADRSGASIERLATVLRESGLASVSEMRLNRMDDLGLDPARVIRQFASGGLPVDRLTVDAADDPDRLMPLERVDDLGRALGGSAPRAFAPLPAVPADTPSTGYDDVKQVALARLVVQSILHIQVDWELYGPKLAQVALMFGADDLDNVRPDEPATNLLGPRRAPLAEVRRNVRAASLEPIERNARFDVVSGGVSLP